MDKYQKFWDLIDEAKTITILSGAGVSTNSGIPDFRSRGGLYDGVESEKIISRKNYNENKKEFWKAYKEIFIGKITKENIQPNIAHEFPKVLKELGKEVYVITQNVDGLYKNLVEKEYLVEYHGNISKLKCQKCLNEEDSKQLVELVLEKELPTCKKCGEDLDVSVTLFGDAVTEHQKAEKMIQKTDIVIVMGTKLEVTPFANLLTGNRKRKNILMNNHNISKKRFELKFIQDISKTIEELKKRKG